VRTQQITISQTIAEAIVVLTNSTSVSGSQQRNGALSHSAKQMRVILPLGQSGVSNFALVRNEIEKKCRLNQSAFSNFSLYVSINPLTVVALF